MNKYVFRKRVCVFVLVCLILYILCLSYVIMSIAVLNKRTKFLFSAFSISLTFSLTFALICFLSLTSFSHSQPVSFILLIAKQIWSCGMWSPCSQPCILKYSCTTLCGFRCMYFICVACSLMYVLPQLDLKLLVTRLRSASKTT